jgi:hypothetical protein
MSAVPGRAAGMTGERHERPYDWMALVPSLVHPMRVAIIEAMLWVDRPISATDMVHMHNEEFNVSFISYHFRMLADPKVRIIEKVKGRRVRGAEEKFLRLRNLASGS